MDGKHLVDAFNELNDKAWQIIHGEYSRSIYWYVNKIISNDEEAEDIVQECFIKVNKHIRDGKLFDTQDGIRKFLYILARNAAISYLRRNNTKINALGSLYKQEENLTIIEDFDVVESSFDELLNAVLKEIDEAPPQQKLAFKLRYFEKKTAIEITVIMNIPKSKVYEYIDKVKNRLRKKFGNQNIEKLL